MRPCGLMAEPTADVNVLDFSAAWQAIRTARKAIMVPPACTSSKYSHACEQCVALCHAETGSFTAAFPDMCVKRPGLSKTGRPGSERVFQKSAKPDGHGKIM